MISSLKQHLKTGSHEQKPKMSYSSPLCLTNRTTNELCEIIEKKLYNSFTKPVVGEFVTKM